MEETNNIENLLIDIYNSTYDDVYRYVICKCRDVNNAGDLMQNIYLNFYKTLKNKRNIREPKKYLISIAKNELYKHYGILKMLRNHVPIFSESNDETSYKFEEDLKFEHNYDEKLLCKEIWNYLKCTDLLTFKIFVLYFKEDLKIKEISNILKIKESTVKNRLYRTMIKINNKFKI
ncbi:RNA polymerase sigma factor [Clostridium taeniosporum]|uniref:Sigma-70 family RNA polymerase sigma factor n=1 Tax=Clostridium taeniosporum TaxID=394958 RepID=A0A1D7XJI2_9CLOT|nr:sigma-70 family RNA polymerase sigma factor [Clostridium taeniosporum]AOR23504.1 sigma-70 family RNA polymerase sigma factor [Clostridium taeniosporum]